MHERSATPANRFKERLVAGERLIGLWTVLADPTTAEMLAGCGYDWMLIDAEHGPFDVRSVLAQVQGITAGASALGPQSTELSQPVVRLPEKSATLIKQYLDVGVRNLLVPMVNTEQEARDLVAATRYPPEGVRGMGSGLARASHWGRHGDYTSVADDGVCLIVQAETREAIENMEQIAAVDGVDGVLFGPADLAADLGHRDQRTHPEVVGAIRRGADIARAAGTPTGIMLTDVAAARTWLDEGMSFAGVGVDATLLVRAADSLLSRFTGDDVDPAPGASY